MTRARSGPAGSTTLPAALAAVAVSAALAGAVAEVARLEVLVARQRRTAASALAAADACLAEVVTAVPPGWDFAGVLAGRDGLTGTADDGLLAAPSGCQASARATTGPPTPARVKVTIDASAAGGRRALEAVVGRTARAGAPALLWLGEAPASGTLTGTLRLDGADAADPAASDLAGVAAPADPAALDAWVAGEGPHLLGTSHTAPPITAFAPPLATLAARLRTAGAAGAEVLVPSGPVTAARALISGDLVVPGSLRGAGLLVVDGLLDVGGSLDFAGVVVATAGVRIRGGGRLAVDGVLWLGPATASGHALLVEGDLSLRQSRSAVAAADVLLPLPRPTAVLGVRDLG